MNLLSKITGLVLFLLISIVSFSQTKIGLKGGANLNNIDSNYGPDYIEPKTKVKVGYHFGLVTQSVLSESLDLYSGLIYNSKGFSLDNLPGDDYARISFNYLEIPFNLNYKTSDYFLMYFGPYVAFGLGGKGVFETDGQSLPEQKYLPKSGEVDINDFADHEVPFKAIDFGLNFGFGVTPSEKTLFSLGYSLGLSNIHNDQTDGTNSFSADETKDLHRVLSLSFTVFP